MPSRTSASVFGLPRGTLVVLAAIILAFALFSLAFTVSSKGNALRKPTGDGVGYEAMAKQLLQKGVYGYKSATPNAYVTPGYPLFLAGLYAISGDSVNGRPRLLLDAIQILLACATLGAVFLVGRLLIGDRAGLLAAALVALYPPTMVATNLWFTETLGTCALMWFVVVALLASRQEGWKLWAAAGVLLALAVLVRPAAVVLGVAPFVALFVAGRRKELLRAAAIMGLAWALVMAPWVVRNVITLHELDVLSSHSGDPLLAGVDPYYYELGPGYGFHGPTYNAFMASGTTATKDQFARQAIVTGFKTQPLLYLGWFTLGKTVHMYSAGWLADTGTDGTRSTLVRGLIVILGWLGVAYSLKDRRLLSLALMVAFGTIALLPFVPEPRFVFSYLPLLAILAGAVVSRLWQVPVTELPTEPTGTST